MARTTSKSCVHKHASDSTPATYGLQIEYKTNPLGIDEVKPRFSYLVIGVSRQTERQIQVLSPDGKTFWDSGWTKGSGTLLIPYEGPALQPLTRYAWRVRVKGDAGEESGWNDEEAWFETGFMGTPWPAKWIRSRLLDVGGGMISCPLFDKRFSLESGHGRVKSARFYGTAFGCYEALLNGQAVTDAQLLPGWTDYFYRVQYQCFDITSLLKRGENRLNLTLATGWHSGRISSIWNQGKKLFPQPPSLMAALRIIFADGHVQTIGTDASFRCTFDGPCRFSDIYDGEFYEADRTLAYLDDPLNASLWAKAIETEYDTPVVWNAGALMRILQTRRPVSITKRGNVYLVDFGQNLAGREILHLHKAPRGCAITIRHGEMLNKDGSLYTYNLRTAHATTTYVCKGGDAEDYQPHFTFFGFRYLEITGWPGRLTSASVEAAVLSSDLQRTGFFNCSDELVNKLYENTGWGLRSNFIDVPTDCPQRDERFGWTGDTQVFCNIATYNVAAGAFYTKWLGDMNKYAEEVGFYPDIMPQHFPCFIRGAGTTGWGDAGLIVPWTLYVKYGDTRLLEQGFKGMRLHLDSQLKAAGKELIGKTCVYGDWLNINVDTSKEYIATAYMAGMARLLSRIATVLGKKAAAKTALVQYNNIKDAFQKHFVDKKGVTERTQCGYLLALHFDLLPQALVKPTVKALVEDIRVTQKLHLSTGFLGTPLLLPVLTRFGHIDLAYDLLLQTTYPGWLYPVTQGATTMWERWNSYTKKDGFGDVGMNSFNHYAYGAVAEWFYETIAGIRPIDEPDAVGFRRFILAPKPSAHLDHADTFFNSPCGPIVSAWDRNDKEKTLVWNFVVPDNTTAIVTLPYPEILSFKGARALEPNGDGTYTARSGEYILILRDK